MCKKAIIINRISSLQQTDGFSLEAQKKHGLAYAKKKGFQVLKEWTFQETASKPNQRKKFQEVINFIDNYNSKHPKQKLVVIVEKPDRLYRNHQDKEWCQHKYLSGQVEFHFYKDGRIFNEESSPTDVFMDDIVTSLNKYAAKNIGREAIKGMQEKCEQGWFPQQAPFGYINVEIDINGRKIKIIKPHIDESIIVKMMFKMRAEKRSFEEIRLAALTHPSLPKKRINKFKHKSSVEFILKNEFYIGRFRWRGKTYNGKHEVYIPEQHFKAAQNLSASATYRVGQKQGVFSNWLRCTCGCKVTYDPKWKTLKTTGEKKKYEYYRCSNGKKIHERYLYLSEDKIFNQLSSAVDKIVITGDLAKDVSTALNKTHQKAKDARKRDIEAFKQGLKKLEVQEDHSYEDFRSGILDESAYKRQIKRVREERLKFTNLMEQAQIEIDDAYLVTAQKIIELAQNAKSLWLGRSRTEQRDFLEKILSNRVFDHPSIRYNLKKPFQTLSKMASSNEWLRVLDLNQRPID